MVAEMSPDELSSERVLRLDEAYQGRAMFVKVQCKVGEAPSQLSHHPELRFRFPPRPADGAPLIANSVSIQVRDGLMTAREQPTNLFLLFFRGRKKTKTTFPVFSISTLQLVWCGVLVLASASKSPGTD